MKLHAPHSLTCLLTQPQLGQNERLPWDTPPSKQLSYARTYLDTQPRKYHPCRLPIWAGCSFILIIFKTKICTSLLCCSRGTHPCCFLYRAASASLQPFTCPCLRAYLKEGNNSTNLLASPDTLKWQNLRI